MRVPERKSITNLVVVVVVWFGDPCESPGALLLTAAPGYVGLLHDREFPEQCNKFFVLSCCLCDAAGAC